MPAPGDDMRARDRAQLSGFLQPSKSGEFCHVAFVSATRFGIGAIGEPFDLGRNVGELLELPEVNFCSLMTTRPDTTCPALFKLDNVFYRVRSQRHCSRFVDHNREHGYEYRYGMHV
jgi:hypothetical protein